MIGIAPNFVRVGGAGAGIFSASLALSGCVDGNQAAPLIGCDLPKFEGRASRLGELRRADTGVVDEDINAAELAARGFDDCVRRGVVSLIGTVPPAAEICESPGPAPLASDSHCWRCVSD
jgi:hypothetical protein